MTVREFAVIVPVAKPRRTQGAYLLGRVGIPDEQIAAIAGCHRVKISLYKNGRRKPGAERRERFFVLFQIPVSAWAKPVELPQPTLGERLQRALRSVEDLHLELREISALGRAGESVAPAALPESAPTSSDLDPYVPHFSPWRTR